MKISTRFTCTNINWVKGCPTEEYELQFPAEARQFSLMCKIHIDFVTQKIPLSNKYLGIYPRVQSGQVVSLKMHLEIKPPSSKPEKCVGGILRFHVSPEFCYTITDVHNVYT